MNHDCTITNEGVSLLAINDTAQKFGFHTQCGWATLDALSSAPMPCILHWNQNHFVVLYRVKNEKKFYVADPGKGRVTYSKEEFKQAWISTIKNHEEKGIAMFLQPTPSFYKQKDEDYKSERSLKFLWGYFKQYRKYFLQIILGLIVGSILQLVLPYLTQAIVDIGIQKQDIGFIWLVLIGQLMITFSRTAIDFVRRWLLLHISMRINISLVSDFFIKLLQLPMSFFDTKLMGDILQRIQDHSRVEKFLTNDFLNVIFSAISLFVFGVVLYLYDSIIFTIFVLGSLLYGGWIALFLRRRRILDYEIFEKQAENKNKSYEFISSMQEIKLQNCEQRRRWEWEDVQADLFGVQMKSLKLQQGQEAGSVFINELKNIIITVVAAMSVINGSLTLGMMLAVQYIIGQLNSPVEQLMNFIYSFQDVKISLERINEIHQKEVEDESQTKEKKIQKAENGISLNHIMFKYDPNSLKKTIENINIHIPQGKVTAIVGSSGSGKTTLVKLNVSSTNLK